MWHGWFRFQTPNTKTCITITKKGFQHKILNSTNLFAVILKNLYKPFHPNAITGKVTKTTHYNVKNSHSTKHTTTQKFTISGTRKR